ncbi:MAG: MiaB/RimO family radical SAM methylthiotransferase, partial [Armatimonadaceae bacterium]
GCTFCAIPGFRGRHRSKPMESVWDEARRLVDSGVVEINLIAQDTTAYGMDLYRELALPRLLEGLSRIAGLRWIRLLYCYPTMVNDRLIRTMADLPNVARYLDVPLQHGDDAMLTRMKRGGSVSSYLRLMDRLRCAMPDIAVRTTFLVGFPGEDDASFRNLCDFVGDARFDRLGVFEYSPEEGTPGFGMKPTVPKRVAARRRRELMELQQGIADRAQRDWVGRQIDVLVEKADSSGFVGRSYRDAPEIDGVVRFSGEGYLPGSWATVRIEESGPYDLAGTAAGPSVGDGRPAMDLS